MLSQEQKKPSILNSSQMHRINSKHTKAVCDQLKIKILQIQNKIKRPPSDYGNNQSHSESKILYQLQQLSSKNLLNKTQEIMKQNDFKLSDLMVQNSSQDFVGNNDKTIKKKFIQIGDQNISVVTRLNTYELQTAQSQSSMYTTSRQQQISRLNSSKQMRFQIFSYSPGIEQFSASPISRRIVENNQKYIHTPPQSRGYKRAKNVKIIKMEQNWQRGALGSARSQRYIQENKQFLHQNNNQQQTPLITNTIQPNQSKIQYDLATDQQKQLVDMLVKYFRKFQVSKKELSDQNADYDYQETSPYGQPVDYKAVQLDLSNYLYSLWDPNFTECLLSLLFEGQIIKTQLVRNFFKRRNINELKYSAFKTHVYKFMRQKLGKNNHLTSIAMQRIDNYKIDFMGEGWFDVFGGEISLKKLITKVADQYLLDQMLASLPNLGGSKLTDHQIQRVYDILLQTIQNRRPPTNLIDKNSKIELTNIQFFRIKQHFWLAMRRSRHSPLAINMMSQILETFRMVLLQTDIQPYPRSSEFLDRFVKLFTQGILKIFSISQLYVLLNSRERFYNFIDSIAVNMVNYLIRDLTLQVEQSVFNQISHMIDELKLLNQSGNFWSFKEAFLQTHLLLSDDKIYHFRICQAFDQIQILLAFTPSIYVDLLHLNTNQEIYEINIKIQNLVTQLITQMKPDEKLNSQIRHIQTNSIGLSFEYQLEWLLQFLFIVNPDQNCVQLMDIKAFMIINGLDSNFLQKIVIEISQLLMKIWIHSSDNLSKIKELIQFGTNYIQFLQI